MAAGRPRHRRWLVRRRRFLDAQGGQVTDTWLNIPLLPRRMVTWRSPDRGMWHIQFSPSPLRFMLPAVLLLAANILAIFRVVGIGQLVRSIPDALMILGGLGILSVLGVQVAHRPERVGE